MLTNSAMQGLLIPTNSTSTVIVPAGRTLHIAGTITWLDPDVRLTQGNLQTVIFPTPDMEIDGPVTVDFITSVGAAYVTYYLKDSVTVLPDGALQVPSGNFEVQVEKSNDLKSWSPSVVIPKAADSTSFYRIRVAD